MLDPLVLDDSLPGGALWFYQDTYIPCALLVSPPLLAVLSRAKRAHIFAAYQLTS